MYRIRITTGFICSLALVFILSIPMTWGQQYRPDNPVMDYVPQYIGFSDKLYRDDNNPNCEVVESDCRDCHGPNTADRHHQTEQALLENCLISEGGCHEELPPGWPPVTDCKLCHTDDPIAYPVFFVVWGDLGYPHHKTNWADAGQCNLCHDPNIIVETYSVPPPTDPPSSTAPTPASCENCHFWDAPSPNTSIGAPGPMNHFGTSALMHPDKVALGFDQNNLPNVGTHHGTRGLVFAPPNSCSFCHWSELGDVYDTNPYNPQSIRYCENCHTRELLHSNPEHMNTNTIYTVNGVPNQEVTRSQKCVACHSSNLAPISPDLTVIRQRLTGKQQLFIYNTPAGLNGNTEPTIATDRNFGNSSGGSNIIAMACFDIDGNGSDEIAVIRQRSGGKQRLEIYDPPEIVGGDTGDPIASDLSFGNLNTDSNNIAVTGVDIDGDGTDEIAVIREKQTGKQGLFIFTPPQTVGGETGGAIATDRSFGFSGTGRNIIAMTGLEFDGDAPDEIAVIVQRASGRQRLEIYDAPQSVGGETGDPIASDLTFGNSTTNKNNIALTSVDVLSDGIDEIAVVRQKTNGRQRLEIYNAPQTVDGETGSPIGSDVSFGTAGTDIYTIYISGITLGESEIVVDDPGAVFVGDWSTATVGYAGTCRYHAAGVGSDTATWTPDIGEAGDYNVYAWWVEGVMATDAPYTIYYDGGSETVDVNQQENGDQWNLLGTYPFAAGTSGYVVLSDDANGTVIADAIKWELQP